MGHSQIIIGLWPICTGKNSTFILKKLANIQYLTWGRVTWPRSIKFTIRLRLDLGHGHLVFASTTNLESRPRFAKIWQLMIWKILIKFCVAIEVYMFTKLFNYIKRMCISNSKYMFAHAFAWLKMLKKCLKIIKNILFSSFVFCGCTKKTFYTETNKSCFSCFNISTWALHERLVLLTKKVCVLFFLSFSTMQTHGQACFYWWKYTTSEALALLKWKDSAMALYIEY